MRQIFQSLPWIHPAVPAPIVEIYRKRGVELCVKKHGVLKSGGENPKSFLLVRGLCAYRIPNDARGIPATLSLIIPGRSMCDISASVDERVNVETVAWQDSVVLAMPPGTLQDEADRNPAFGRYLLQDVIAKQESHLEGMTANFTLDPQTRLKTLFKVLLTAYGRPTEGEGLVLPLLLNNSQYGQIVNLSRVTVSRILGHWQDEGLIRKDGRAITVSGRLFSDIYDWLDGTGKAENSRLENYHTPPATQS